MKMYKTEYITKSNISRVQQSHTPQLPDKLIGDFIQVTIFEGIKCPNSDDCDCGETHVNYTSMESEIVEIRQTVEEIPYKMELLGVWNSNTSV